MWLSLIGFMGSGKSTVARLLGEHALLDVQDLDAVIETDAGRTVADIFAAGGAAAFRDLELAALQHLPTAGDIVLACGGGVVERTAACELLRSRGAVVWLDAPWEILRQRLAQSDTTERPLLGRGWADAADLLRARLPLYARTAHFRFRSDLAEPRELVSRVLAAKLYWERRGGRGES
ncbi:shikimate kinase [bacterium]|nr:shikimate kinase [bacterium]